MGLDMYAFATTEKPDQPVDFEIKNKESLDQIHYWRKHPNLHGWMRRLYAEKGGAERDFNVTPVMVELPDLVKLEADVRAGLLPETTGFFFGHSDGSEQADDLEFIQKARESISAGKRVIYIAWY